MNYIKLVLFQIYISRGHNGTKYFAEKKFKRIPIITKAAGNLPVLLSYDFSSKFWSIKIL